MLPVNAINVLRKGNWCFEGAYNVNAGEFIVTKDDRDFFLNELKVASFDSAFVDFYSVVAFPPIGNGAELYTLDQIIDSSESGYHFDGYPEIGNRYLQLTSIEGEGSYFYDKETDAVYDVNWGEEADMISEKKQPWFTSFYDFLEWYYSGIDE